MQTNSVKSCQSSKICMWPRSREYTFFFLSWFTKKLIQKVFSENYSAIRCHYFLSKPLAEKQEIKEERLGIPIFHHLIGSHTPAVAINWKLADHQHPHKIPFRTGKAHRKQFLASNSLISASNVSKCCLATVTSEEYTPENDVCVCISALNCPGSWNSIIKGAKL